jgi:manganese/iron transport system substrate-binding protein
VFPSAVLEQIAAETGVAFIADLRDDEPPGAPGAPEHTYMGMLARDMVVMMDALGGQGSATFADYPVTDTWRP